MLVRFERKAHHKTHKLRIMYHPAEEPKARDIAEYFGTVGWSSWDDGPGDILLSFRGSEGNGEWSLKDIQVQVARAKKMLAAKGITEKVKTLVLDA